MPFLDGNTASTLPADAVPLSHGYRPPSGVFDEMCSDSGALRPHWEYLIRSLEGMGGAAFQGRREALRRLLHENGVTYHVYDDPHAVERLWPLDPIPVLLTSSEWSTIEHGLIQRAELLDAILADLYGPRHLISRRLLPPELIYAHPGFLRPCAGVRQAGRRHLTLYAADLARGPDGQTWVIGDRTQAPSGAGYALENRTVLARVLPSVYRDSHVHRLALYFRAVRTALHAMDPYHRDVPRVALLTPGPENEAYFEHAYLADYLGCTLVQGGDLTVRGNRVWLKALDGLKPVDVILRRVDDVYCDPLELRGDSLLGTPGLLQAARLGHVGIANSLGSSVLENPGLLSFLPKLAREILGEELALPSVATWWCGAPDGLSYVLDNLDRLVIKPIAPHPSTSTVFGMRLSQQERAALATRIRDRPHLFVGQERVMLSTAPVVADDHLEPRPMVLRSFLVASDEGYVAMPGGLSRVAPTADTWVVSNQQGGVSKDVWVLASEPERHVSLLSPLDQPLPLMRDGDDVPGRVADDLYWLGRYAERTDGGARLLREVLLRMIGSERTPQDDALALLLCAVTVQTGTYPGFVGTDQSERLRARLRTPEREILTVLLDRNRTGSLRYDIDALVRTGRSVRDRLSGDASRVISALNRELARPLEIAGALEALQRVIMLLAAFTGLSAESMSRGAGWRFLESGRHLERAIQMLTLLRALFLPACGGTSSGLEALLAVAHSLKTYRRRYRSRVQAGAVLDLLFLDEGNPRSVAFQLVQLDALVRALEGNSVPQRSLAKRLSLEALTQIRLFDVGTFAGSSTVDDLVAHPTPAMDQLDALLLHLTRLLSELSDELTRRYFTHAEAPQQLIHLV